MLQPFQKPLAADAVDKGGTLTDARCDVVCEIHGAIRTIIDKMTYERRTFFEQLHINPDDDDTWLRSLVTVALQINEDYRRQAREEISTAHQRACALDACVSLKRDFSRIVRCANGLRRDLSKMVQCYQKNRFHLGTRQREQLRLQLDYVRNGVSICVTQEREARAKSEDLLPLLEFLALPQDDFVVALEAFPAYSPANAVKNRLTGLVKCLRDVTNECLDIQRTTGRYFLQVSMTWHLDLETTSTSDKETLIANYQSLRQEVERHAALQSKALATIRMEFDAARNLPTVVQHAHHVFTISELLEALSAYDLLKGELDTIVLQQGELRESLSAASSELLAASMPT